MLGTGDGILMLKKQLKGIDGKNFKDKWDILGMKWRVILEGWWEVSREREQF